MGNFVYVNQDLKAYIALDLPGGDNSLICTPLYVMPENMWDLKKIMRKLPEKLWDFSVVVTHF